MEEYTAAMPWYEPEDFQLLWELAHDGADMPPRYEDWRRNAEAAMMNASLARGRALQIMTVRPEPFLAWLKSRSLLNTAENRRRYVEDLATRHHDAA